MFELMDAFSQDADIRVLGIGVSGINAVHSMSLLGIGGATFNYLGQDLKRSGIDLKLLDSPNTKIIDLHEEGVNTVTANNELSAYDKKLIEEFIDGCDLLFIVADLGETFASIMATRTGRIAIDKGVLTLAVVSQPINIKVDRTQIALEHSSKELSENVDSLISIPLGITSYNKYTPLVSKYTKKELTSNVNDIVYHTVRGVTELISCPGLINVDFADVRTVMSNKGWGISSFGRATGEDRATEATIDALEAIAIAIRDKDLSRAKGVLVNVTAGLDLAIGELDDVGSLVTEKVSDDATVVVGTVIDETLSPGEIFVVIVATGIKTSKVVIDIPEVKEGSSKQNIPISNVRLIAKESSSDEDLAEIIAHLSNVYKSIGGDELIIENILDIPPDSKIKYVEHDQKKYGILG